MRDDNDRLDDEFLEPDELEELPADELPDTGEPPAGEKPGADEAVPHLDPLWLKRMNALSIPAVILTDSLAIRWRNRAFTGSFEGHRDSSAPAGIDDFFLSGDESPLSEMIRPHDQVQGCYSWHGRIRTQGRSVDNFVANLLLFPMDFDKDGRPDNYLGLVDDITVQYREILQNTFLSLLEASKLKDNDTGHHIERVNRYSFLMAKRLLFSEKWPDVDQDFVENIGFLAAMHDVGKIGVPDDILNKEGPLEDWEMEVMKEHTKNGAFILGSYPNPMAREIALFHHEKWNGEGYPYGIAEEMIPLSARIVSIADVYDALRSRRSYKKPFSHKKSLEIMEAQKGTHFDPVLMDVFLKFNRMFEKAFDELSDPSDLFRNEKD